MSGTGHSRSVHFAKQLPGEAPDRREIEGVSAMHCRIAEVGAFTSASSFLAVLYRAARSGAALLSGEKDRIAIAQRSVLAPDETDSASRRSRIPALGPELGARPTGKSVPDSRR